MAVPRFDGAIHDEQVPVADVGLHHALARHAHQERGWWVRDEQFVEVELALQVIISRRGEPRRTSPAKRGSGTRRRGNGAGR